VSAQAIAVMVLGIEQAIAVTVRGRCAVMPPAGLETVLSPSPSSSTAAGGPERENP
jgi:hypothetical protein